MEKSELLVTQTYDTEATQLAVMMGYRLGEFPFIYLGLLLSNRGLKKAAFIPLIQRFNKRLAGWAAKHLSLVGRLVLINVLLSSLPVYYMSCL